MANSTGLPVLQYMQRWTNQQGVPLVNVARSDDGSKLLLTQQVISNGMHEGPEGLVCGSDLATPLELPGGGPANAPYGNMGGLLVKPEKYAWWIPVTYTPVDTSRNTTEATGAAEDEGFVEMKDCTAEAKWPVTAQWPEGSPAIKVNAGQWGVYRFAHCSFCVWLGFCLLSTFQARCTVSALAVLLLLGDLSTHRCCTM